MNVEERGLTLRELVETPHMASLWGVDYHLIRPVLIDEVFGDGLQLVGFTTINSRPNYYVIQADSGWGLDAGRWGWDATDGFVNHLEEVYNAIEEEWGRSHCGYCEERYGQRCEDAAPCEECEGALPEEGEFPALDAEGGCSWFAYDPLR